MRLNTLCALPFALALASGHAHAYAGEPVLRVYDARPLSAVLPRRDAAPLPGAAYAFPARTDGSAANPVPAGRSGGAPAGGSVEQIVGRLCDQLGLASEPIGDGVFLVSGEAAQHEQFSKLVEDLRSLYGGSYELELATFTVPAAQAPAVGSACDAQTATLRTRQVVARRVESRITMTEEIGFVRDWVPVVGNDAVGYDPDPGVVVKGLRLCVTVGGTEGASPGGGRPGAGVVSVKLQGEWCDAVIEKQGSPLGPQGGGVLELGLPHVALRSIDSEARISPGQLSVLAVVPGSRAGEAVVIAGAVREVK